MIKKSDEKERLPKTREAITKKMVLPGGYEDFVATGEEVDGEKQYVLRKQNLNAYMTVGMYEDGRPGELFMKVGKAGDFWAVYDALAIAVSIGLQYGVPIEDYVSKFRGLRFRPSGVTTDMGIPLAKSIPDFLAIWLESIFCKDGNDGTTCPNTKSSGEEEHKEAE